MKSVLFLCIGMLSLNVAFAESYTPIQYQDVAEIMMKKYTLQVDDIGFTIFYRFSTQGEGESSDEDLTAKITSIDIDKERKSMILTVDGINQKDIMSIRFPQQVLSAEGKNMTLLIDDKEKAYESSTQESKNTMIFVLPAKTTKIEIIGTRVIPEFSVAIVSLFVILSSVVLIQKLRKI